MFADAGAFWSVDAATLGAILAMAAATYGVRAGGFWLISRVQPNRFVEAWLRQIPGAMFVALIVPALAAGGPAFWAGGAVVLAVRLATGNLLASLVAGAAAVALVRLYLIGA
jgi:uncharacterized membrane protein